ncbi:MAG: DUF308 domain-containing protein [Lachnospiraceae bacterium]|nr:DUF308 domain-containing protein [Lachnospiraceae bacterium]
MGEDLFFVIFRSVRRNKLISGILFAVLGITFLVSPFASMVTVSRLLGWALLLGGGFQIFAAVSGTPGMWMHNPYFYIGILLAILGIIVIRDPYTLLNWFNIIFGVIIVTSSVTSLIHAEQMRKYTDGATGVWKLLPILGIVLGVLVILNPFGTISLFSRVIGCVLLYEAFVHFGNFYDMNSIMQ